MSSMFPLQPFGDLISLSDAMNRLLEDSFVSPRGTKGSLWDWQALVGMGEPSLDVYETAEAVVVKATLPGLKPEDVEITLTGDVLTVQGETKEETEQEDKNYLRRERRYGSFTRSITLPEGLQGDKADAKFENGVLTLTIPKSEEVKPKTIKVKAASNDHDPKK